MSGYLRCVNAMKRWRRFRVEIWRLANAFKSSVQCGFLTQIWPFLNSHVVYVPSAIQPTPDHVSRVYSGDYFCLAIPLEMSEHFGYINKHSASRRHSQDRFRQSRSVASLSGRSFSTISLSTCLNGSLFVRRLMWVFLMALTHRTLTARMSWLWRTGTANTRSMHICVPISVLYSY